MSGPHVVFIASLLAAAGCGYVIAAWRHSSVKDGRVRSDVRRVQQRDAARDAMRRWDEAK